MFREGVKRAQYQCIIWKTSPVINPDKSMPNNYGLKRDCDKYCPVMMSLPMTDPEGDRGSGHPPLENNKYVHGFLKKLAFGPPPPRGKSLTPTPGK